LSLIGNLEDLSLPDILQIISLSKKSGVLIIQRGEEEGKVYLRQGKVILATSLQNRRNFGRILVAREMITEDQLEEALRVQKIGGMRELLGLVMVKMGLLTREALDKVVQEQIEETVYYFLTWNEGTFKFDLRDVDGRLEVEIDLQTLISHKGIDTQWLVLEGTRLLDERRRTGTDNQPFFEEENADGTEQPVVSSVVLVDDDEYFSRLFVEAARKRNFAVIHFPGVNEIRERISGLAVPGVFFVIDVVMPTADGRGFLGGFEVAREISSSHPGTRFRVVTAYPDDSIHEELRKMDAPPLLVKPDLSGPEGPESAVEGFFSRLMETIGRPGEVSGFDEWEFPGEEEAAAPETPLPPPPAPPPEEFLESMTAQTVTAADGVPELRQVTLDLLEEIKYVNTASEVGLLILRLASETVERAILLKTSGGEAVSLGGFGFDAAVMHSREGLRNLSIGLNDSPSLKLAVEGKAVVRKQDCRIQPGDRLAGVVGEPLPLEWVIVPARGVGETVIILYGDNGVTGRGIKGWDVLQRFLKVAGHYMRELQAAAGPDAAPGGRKPVGRQ
jgi:CheY-like chemotaxis protein